MNAAVTDTHALVWHLSRSPRLTQPALAVLQAAGQGNARIWVPAIVVVEIIYLSERGRIPADLLRHSLERLETPNGSYAVAPLDLAVARCVARIPRAAVPEMPD